VWWFGPDLTASHTDARHFCKSQSDANEEAVQLVRPSTDEANELPADLEAACEEWACGIQEGDNQTWAFLRVAFEAGAAVSPPARDLRS
jgi:hypothetical protein